MTEPVGNLPRADAAGNSHKQRAERAAPPSSQTPTPPEKAEKVIEGTAVIKKSPWYRRMSRSMVVEDAPTVFEGVLQDVIIPTTKNLVRDAAVGLIERTLYGSVRTPAGVRPPVVGGSRPPLRHRYDTEPSREPVREARHNRVDVGNITLRSITEAENVLARMFLYLEEYGLVSLSDLYDFVGVSGAFTDRNYGWRDLKNAAYRQVRDGYQLVLPDPTLLR